MLASPALTSVFAQAFGMSMSNVLATPVMARGKAIQWITTSVSF